MIMKEQIGSHQESASEKGIQEGKKKSGTHLPPTRRRGKGKGGAIIDSWYRKTTPLGCHDEPEGRYPDLNAGESQGGVGTTKFYSPADFRSSKRRTEGTAGCGEKA